jgi:hypothetical protein
MEHRKAEWMDVVRRHIYSGNPASYAKLAQAYLRNSVPEQQCLEQRVIKVRTLSNGVRLVNIPGPGEMRLEVAAHLDLI